METAETVRRAFDLTGRVAVVTGAGSGIGRATAEVLAGAGAAVYCADVREAAAEETAAAILAAGAGPAYPRRVDVSEADEVAALVGEAAGAHGRLDVLCNIAGTMLDGSVLDLAGDDLDRVLAVNLKGVLHGCQAAGRVMVAQGSGSIVNMSSTAALTPAPQIGAYAISKAAVIQLTRTMAVEVGRHGVRVNAVAPGFVPTNMTARYYRRPDGTIDEELREQVLAPVRKLAPLRRVGEPADIAYCVLYLASDASSFLTGQCLSLDPPFCPADPVIRPGTIRGKCPLHWEDVTR
jgi:3-oxoacyl-[acyl-carrier protein] reductase